MNYGNAIMYIINSFNKIPEVFKGITYYTSGIGQSFNRLKEKSSHLNMTEVENEVYTAFGISFWLSSIFGIIILVLSCMQAGIWGIFGGIFGMAGELIGMAFILLIYSLFVFLGNKYKDHWNMLLMKFLIVLYFISIFLTLWGVIGDIRGVISAIRYFSGYSMLYSIISLLEAAVVLMSSGLVLNALNKGVPVNYQASNTFQNNSQMNNQNYWENQNINSNGLSGLGAVNDRKIGGSIQQEEPMQQLYACPYCGGAITQGTNPCPHCNQQVNWQS